MNIGKRLWFLSSGGIPEYSNLLFGSALSSAPSDFTTSADFTFTGGVLNSTGTATNTGWDSYARWSYLSSQERQRILVNFNINSTTSVFRAAKYNTNSWAQAGSVAEVDFENSLLKLYNVYLPTAIPTVLQQTAITVTINTAHDYTLSFSKKDLQTVIILTNSTTGESTTLTRNQSGSTFPEGIFRGQVSLMHVKGDIDFTGLYYYTLYTNTPLIAFYGDSYIDGYSLIDTLTSRWTYRVYIYENGDALISGWGGNTSADLITRSKDYEGITPKNVLIHVGYNEAVLATWKTNLETLIDTFVAKGCNIILPTYAPSLTVNAVANINSMNSYIISRGYQILDIGALLTVGGDRVTINGALILADNAHPNEDGHDLIYADAIALDLYETQKLNSGISNYFKFQGNANSETGLDNGTLVAAPSSATGIIGNCYTFNGSTQYISFSDSANLSFVNASGDIKFSISCWVYPTSFAATNYIFTKRPSSLEYSFFINTSGKIVAVLFSGGAGTITIARITQAAISINQWTHIVFTYDGSETSAGIKIYVNGALMATDDVSASSPYVGMSNTATSAYIGGFSGAAGGYTGKIDEFGIWRGRELSLANVQSLYNSGAALDYSNFITS